MVCHRFRYGKDTSHLTLQMEVTNFIPIFIELVTFELNSRCKEDIQGI